MTNTELQIATLLDSIRECMQTAENKETLRDLTLSYEHLEELSKILKGEPKTADCIQTILEKYEIPNLLKLGVCCD